MSDLFMIFVIKKKGRNLSVETTFLPEGLLLTTASNREYTSSLEGLERAMASGRILEGVVKLCDKDFNLHIDFPSLPEVKGIIPREEAAMTQNGERVKDIAILTRVGKAICFKVMGIEIKRNVTVVYLSRRAAQLECFMKYLSGLIPGDVIRARITHLESFGAFVDIGCGLPSLLSVDSISVSRISHPKDRLWCGELVWVVVKAVDRDNGRIFVSMKELLGTWEENADEFEPGQTVTGVIRSIEDYGVFIELAPNLAGLAEIRENDKDTQLARVGQYITVFIKSIIPERMKIKLVMIDSYKGELPSRRMKYFVDTEKIRHIEHWRYSPEKCRKVIESIF
jgi:small subunit ribosomal protein S1